MESNVTKKDIENDIKKESIRVDKFDTEKGGIYLEMTDDPRGWMLGDETRRIYKATIGQVAALTNLLVTVHPHWDGIKVKVHNPRDVSRMLTSLNDDVGSSVRYAFYEGSDTIELCADMGQHICIESITNRNWIRVQIFPGKNVSYDMSGIGSWVQDVYIIDASSALERVIDKNAEYIKNTGSKYIIGPAKGEDPDKVGIYFIDNTKFDDK